jgi:putative peptidoglycan lipid II flippase
LVLLGEPMIGAVYQHGAFEAYDTQQTARALTWYALGLAGYSALKVLSPAFYALGDARTPMYISLMSIAVNYATALTMVRYLHLGHAGLALSTSAVALFGFGAQLLLIRNRLGGIHGRQLLTDTLKIAAASGAMAAAVFASHRGIEAWLGTAALPRLVDLAVSIPLGAGVLAVVCKLLRVAELEEIWRLLSNRLMGRRPARDPRPC